MKHVRVFLDTSKDTVKMLSIFSANPHFLRLSHKSRRYVSLGLPVLTHTKKIFKREEVQMIIEDYAKSVCTMFPALN